MVELGSLRRPYKETYKFFVDPSRIYMKVCFEEALQIHKLLFATVFIKFLKVCNWRKIIKFKTLARRVKRFKMPTFHVSRKHN